jgi:hypothetical protein
MTDAKAAQANDPDVVAKDIFIALDRCSYCGRPGSIVWDDGVMSCSHEVCEGLAYREVRRRHQNSPPDRRQRVKYLRAPR